MSGRSAVAEVMDGAGPVSAVAAELSELEAAMADPDQADEMDEHHRALRRGAGAASRSSTAMRSTAARARCWPASASARR